MLLDICGKARVPSGSHDNSSLAFLPRNLTVLLLLLLYHRQHPPWQEMASNRSGHDIPQSHQQGGKARGVAPTGLAWAPYLPLPRLWAEVRAHGLAQPVQCPPLDHMACWEPWREGESHADTSPPPRGLLQQSSGFPGANANTVISEGLISCHIPQSRKHRRPVQLSRHLLSTY